MSQQNWCKMKGLYYVDKYMKKKNISIIELKKYSTCRQSVIKGILKEAIKHQDRNSYFCVKENIKAQEMVQRNEMIDTVYINNHMITDAILYKFAEETEYRNKELVFKISNEELLVSGYMWLIAKTSSNGYPIICINQLILNFFRDNLKLFRNPSSNISCREWICTKSIIIQRNKTHTINGRQYDTIVLGVAINSTSCSKFTMKLNWKVTKVKRQAFVLGYYHFNDQNKVRGKLFNLKCNKLRRNLLYHSLVMFGSHSEKYFVFDLNSNHACSMVTPSRLLGNLFTIKWNFKLQTVTILFNGIYIITLSIKNAQFILPMFKVLGSQSGDEIELFEAFIS